MPKVGLVGFGQVGIETAKVLVQDPTITYDIVAYDLKEMIEKVPGPQKGNYEDILDGIGILGYGDSMELTYDLNKMSGCAAIVFTAGRPRTADMTRADLIGVNIPIVGGICEKLKYICPDAFYIMVTNPLDSMVELAYRTLKCEPSKIVGQAGVLDSGRFRIQASIMLNKPVSQIQAITLGGHGPTMVPVFSHTYVGYKPIKDLLTDEQSKTIVENVKDRGRFIITQKGHSSTYSTALAVWKMLRAYFCDTKEIMACSTRLQGEYGHRDVFAGVPTEISAKGARPVEIQLTQEEKELLDKSIKAVREEVAELDRLTQK